MNHKRIYALLGFVILLCTTAVAETPGRTRSDGPLKREHFKAEVPSDSTLDAVVYAQLRYDYKFKTKVTDNSFVLTCTALFCCGEQLPDQSWMRDSADTKLLDHEQGHLDLAEMVARKAESRLRYLVRKGKLKSTGATVEEAEKALVRSIRAQLIPFGREIASVNHEYDRVTSHGQDEEAQKAERLKQRTSMRSLPKRTMPSLSFGK